MFFQTPFHLLKPIHSLLSKPFDFGASRSIGEKLKGKLGERGDYAALLRLAEVYDAERDRLHSMLPELRHRLENELSPTIPPHARLDDVLGASMKHSFNIIGGTSAENHLAMISAQCQLERLSDHLELKETGRGNCLNEPNIRSVIRFLMLNESLALALAGLVKVHHEANVFVLSPLDLTAAKTFKTIWFARWIDNNSHSSTIGIAKYLGDSKADLSAQMELLVDRLFDQNLSISWANIGSDGRSLESIKAIRSTTTLAAALLIAGLLGKKIKMSRSDLSQYGVDYGTAAALLRYQAQTLATNRFVLREGDFLTLQIGALSKGLRAYYDYLADDYKEVDKLREHVGGRHFENVIRHELETSDSYTQRYRIAEGFDRYKVIDDAENEADVEFIIFDKKTSHYYFIQIKHALLGEKAFFSAAIQASQKDFAHGLHQLREAKRLLCEGNLIKTLTARDMSGANPANSSFILLHNIAQFDFQCTEDHIGLYDWATFRKLLLDASVITSRPDGTFCETRLGSPLKIDHPDLVIQRLVSELPPYRDNQDAIWAAERISLQYEIGGFNICHQGLGI